LTDWRGSARDTAPDAVAALRDILVAYAGFAAEHPAHMRVMLRPELASPATYTEVTASSAAPIDLLRDTIIDAQRDGALPPGDPEPALHLFWSLAVGYVTLWLDGPVEARCLTLGTSPDEMIRRVAATVEQLLRRPLERHAAPPVSVRG
jgi:AcrR family transcriptional regulator